MNTIVSVETRPSERLLVLRYADGVRVEVDFRPIIATGGNAARLSDPLVFARVQPGPRGRWVSWGDDLEFCADALREVGHVTGHADGTTTGSAA